MITIRDKSKFWEFLYGMEKTIKLPEENGPHHSIARIIVDSYDFEEFSNKIRKKSKRNLDFKLITINKGTLEKDIKSGEISIATLTSILCYFFFKISILAEEKENLIIEIEKLKALFKLLGNSSIKAKERSYINLVLNFNKEKFNLNEFELTINENFELISNYNSLKSELQNQHLLYEFSDAVLTFDLIDKIENYRLKLKEEFKQIRIGFANLSIPIEHAIELPFNSIDQHIIDELTLLENELKFSQEENDFKKVVAINNKIEKLNSLKKESNSPNEILNRGKDIFILSKAGSGKTTTLKNFTYNLASSENKLPVFIELQFYKSDLKSLINESLEPYNLDFNTIKNHSKTDLIILIDAFDEFRANESKLLSEIENIKKTSNCQIVLSGRFKPNALTNIELHYYELCQFSHQDTCSIFTYIFPNKGQKYFDDLKKEGLLGVIETPLFLFLLIAHLKKEKEIELKFIRELIENKGKLLKTVLIDDFIYSYESKKKVNVPKYQWEENKRVQIQIISIVAYYLTFELNKMENSNSQKEKVIDYLKNNTNYPLLDYNELFHEFNTHSILIFNRDYVGFDKKEIRLFFASNYLSKQIKTSDDYYRCLTKFKGDSESLESIERYVFGLINPNIFMVDLKAYVVKDQIIYDPSFTNQMEYALKFIHSGNSNTKIDLINKFYFLNTIVMILFNHTKFEKSNKINEDFKLLINLFFNWIRKFKKPLNVNFHRLISRINYDYHNRDYKKNMSDFIALYRLREILKSPQSEKVFREIKAISTNFIKLDYSLESTIIHFSQLDKSPNLILCFVDNLIFDHQFRIKKNSYHQEKYKFSLENLIVFLERFFVLNTHLYLDYYFSTHQDFNAYNLKTLYCFYKKNSVIISSEKILPQTKEAIVSIFNQLAHHNHSKNKHLFSNLINYSLHYLLGTEIKNELLNLWINEIVSENTDIKTKERLLSIYSNHPNIESIPILISFLGDTNLQIKLDAVWGLIKYISNYPPKDESIVNIINSKLHLLFNESDINLKHKIIRTLEIFQTYPSDNFREDILKFNLANKLHLQEKSPDK